MEYKCAILEFVDDETIDWSSIKWSVTEKILREWMNARNKHSVIDFFDNYDNRLCYAKRLYGCRVDCFKEILRVANSNQTIQHIMKNKSSIVSFGCGPGPEIAAYISYVRNVLDRKYHRLEIDAIDCLPGWAPFLESVKYLDDYATIDFKAELLSNRYLTKMKPADVCIMSYPHAMNFEDIWTNLKRKFMAIIFIDQAKGPLLQKAKFHGFQFVNFEFNGPKTFFYYIDKNYVAGECEIASKCRRGLHDVLSTLGNCLEKVDVTLPCGHSAKILCFQENTLTQLRLKCSRMVKSTCARDMHESVNICGTNQVCNVLINVRRRCGHVESKMCHESSTAKEPCMVSHNKICSAGLHSKKMPCSSTFICFEQISKKLECGHKKLAHCNDKSDTKCEQTVYKACNRGVHFQMTTCSSQFNCNQIVKLRRPCGHECAIKCYEEIVTTCLEKVVTNCKRRLHKEVRECHESKICNVKCVLELPCGCSKVVVCNDYDSIGRDNICHGDCKEKVRDRYMILRQQEGSRLINGHQSELCCTISSGVACQEVCNKVLGCGHRCMWNCDLCLGGRLHRRCLTKCPRTLVCGHLCAKYCHNGTCRKCSVKCLFNKFVNLFHFKTKISSNKKSDWTKFLLETIENGPSELSAVFEKLFLNINHKRFSLVESQTYQTSLEIMMQLIDFYDSSFDDNCNDLLKIYNRDVNRSIVAMLRWVDPSDGNVRTPSSLIDFKLEFQRIKSIVTISRIITSFIATNEFDKNNDILDILNEIMKSKYSEELHLNIKQSISDIMSKPKIDID